MSAVNSFRELDSHTSYFRIWTMTSLITVQWLNRCHWS